MQWSWETAAPEDSAARASPEVRGGSQQRLQHTGPHLHLQGGTELSEEWAGVRKRGDLFKRLLNQFPEMADLLTVT